MCLLWPMSEIYIVRNSSLYVNNVRKSLTLIENTCVLVSWSTSLIHLFKQENMPFEFAYLFFKELWFQNKAAEDQRMFVFRIHTNCVEKIYLCGHHIVEVIDLKPFSCSDTYINGGYIIKNLYVDCMVNFFLMVDFRKLR